jgi:2-desacetyl-2-hydroxyethyl bacteriochlorophyllide A dehydrogenase
MQALIVEQAGEIALESRDVPTQGPGDVMIRPIVVGVCGTDLDIIDGRIDPSFVSYPIVIGHEWSGVVVEPGGAAGVTAGDHVVVEGVVPCGHCAACAAGETNLCETYDEFGFVRDGAMTELLVAPARLVHRLAPGVSLESGALVEPAAVVLRALLRVNPHPGQRVLVIGDGTVALLAARLIRLWSPGSVTMLGRRSVQSGLARLAGVDQFATDPAAAGTGFDIVIEAAGAADAVESAFRAPARGGQIVLLGFPGHRVTVPIVIDDLVNGDITVMGSFSYTSAAWSQVVALLNAGALDLGFLVTHRFGLARWADAIDALRHEPGARGKVLVEVQRAP